jgi:hypothetical protein
LCGVVRGMGPKGRAVVVVIDEEDGDPTYLIEHAGPRLEEWEDILGVLATGMAYAQSEMFGPPRKDGASGE